jgi:lipoprotein-anchoring transpeptidase ErfK/SrfK
MIGSYRVPPMSSSPRSSRLRIGPHVVLAVAAGCASSPRTVHVEPAPARTPVVAAAPAPVLPARPQSPEELGSRQGEEAAKVAAISGPEKAPETVEPAPGIPLPRITSVALFTHIYLMPSKKSYPLGYVHVGSSVALRRSEPLRLEGCPTAWYAVEPRGFVCNDLTTILETDRRQLSQGAERMLKGLRTMAPNDGPLPYGYALSLGTPMYGRIPELDEQKRQESMYGSPPVSLGSWAKGHDGLASASPVATTHELPWFFANGAFSPVTESGRFNRLVRKLAPPGSMISYGAAFEADGRTWLVTPELSAVPADRVRIYRPTSFHGVELGDSVRLPLAWIRKRPRVKWRAMEGGRFAPTDEAWALRTAVGLTGTRVTQGDRVLLETVEPGAYLDEADASVVEKNVERPARVGEGDKWIRISVLGGTLTAYEGDKAVFATLISPGIGGVSPYKYPTVHALAMKHTTPLGVHRIQFKDRFSVMSPDPEQKKFFISDVPYIQYFYGPFALHATYWHEDFGEPKSGGCINLAPADAARLFAWTDPPLPTGWHAVRPGGPNGPGTIVQVVP